MTVVERATALRGASARALGAGVALGAFWAIQESSCSSVGPVTASISGDSSPSTIIVHSFFLAELVLAAAAAAAAEAEEAAEAAGVAEEEEEAEAEAEAEAAAAVAPPLAPSPPPACNTRRVAAMRERKVGRAAEYS